MAAVFPAGFFRRLFAEDRFCLPQGVRRCTWRCWSSWPCRSSSARTVARTKSWFRLWGDRLPVLRIRQGAPGPLPGQVPDPVRSRSTAGSSCKLIAVIVAPRGPDRPPARHGGLVHPLRLHPAGHPAEESAGRRCWSSPSCWWLRGGVIGWHSLLKPYQKDRIISFLNPGGIQELHRLPHHPVQDRHRLGRPERQGLPARARSPATSSCRPGTPISSSRSSARNSASSAPASCSSSSFSFFIASSGSISRTTRNSISSTCSTA